MHRHRLRSAFLLTCTLLLLSPNALSTTAFAFPDKPVTIVVTAATGGGTDFIARVLAQQLTKLWNKTVVIENRLGASGALGNQVVAKSPSDGYTLLWITNNITSLSAIRSDLPYDVNKSFTPIVKVAANPIVIAVNSSVPVNNLKELIALAKSQPGKVSYGSGGVGGITHLVSALFWAMADAEVAHVPYKGSGENVVGAAAGDVTMVMSSPNALLPLVQANKLKLLAVANKERSPMMPSVPTINEAGVPGYFNSSWYGLVGPANMPKELVSTIYKSVIEVMNSPEIIKTLKDQGAEASTATPEAFAQFIRDDLALNEKSANIAGVPKQ